MQCYVTFGTAVITIVTDHTQVRVWEEAESSSRLCWVFVEAFALVLLYLVEMSLVGCGLYSTEYRPCLIGYFSAHFCTLCNLFAL